MKNWPYGGNLPWITSFCLPGTPQAHGNSNATAKITQRNYAQKFTLIFKCCRGTDLRRSLKWLWCQLLIFLKLFSVFNQSQFSNFRISQNFWILKAARASTTFFCCCSCCYLAFFSNLRIFTLFLDFPDFPDF